MGDDFGQIVISFCQSQPVFHELCIEIIIFTILLLFLHLVLPALFDRILIAILLPDVEQALFSPATVCVLELLLLLLLLFSCSD